MSHAVQVLGSCRATISFAGGSGKKATIPIKCTPGGVLVRQLRVVPSSLAGSDQTYSTWVSNESDGAVGDFSTVFADVDRAIAAGSSFTEDEQVYKSPNEGDFYVAVKSAPLPASPSAEGTFYVFIELDSVAAAEFDVEVFYEVYGTFSSRRSIEVAEVA